MKNSFRVNNDGHHFHNGDCRWWQCQICDCGLFHFLNPLSKEAKEKYYLNFEEHYSKHCVNCNNVFFNNYDNKVKTLAKADCIFMSWYTLLGVIVSFITLIASIRDGAVGTSIFMLVAFTVTLVIFINYAIDVLEP